MIRSALTVAGASLLALSVVLGLAGCSAPEETERVLLDAGYEDVELLGWAPWHCGEDDTWSTKWRATNPRGRKVEGVVCCGLALKDCTIRH